MAWILNCSMTTLDELVSKKLIGSFRVGRTRLFRPECVVEFIRLNSSNSRASYGTGALAGRLAVLNEDDWHRMERLILMVVKEEVARSQAALSTLHSPLSTAEGAA